MDSDEVARYLKEHPEFFEEHAEWLCAVQIPHPHGGRAIPIAERQMLTLRERSRVLEGKLRELVQFGEENDSISERMHRTTLALLAARDLPALLDSLCGNLRDDFAVPGVALRLWLEAPAHDRVEFGAVAHETRLFAETLDRPYFSPHPMFDSGAWFGENGATLRSFAYVPLRSDKPVGLLVLGSDDPQRFSADKGTLYLARLGEVVSMALKRYANT